MRTRLVTALAAALLLTACGGVLNDDEDESSSVTAVTLVGAGRPLPSYTPGAVAEGIGLADLCPHLSNAWDDARRTLGVAQKRLTLARYGISDRAAVSEWDHLIPRELGGADTIENIWPMTDRPTDQHKDRLENRLHRQVCSGQLTLVEAQAQALRYWEHW